MESLIVVHSLPAQLRGKPLNWLQGCYVLY